MLNVAGSYQRGQAGVPVVVLMPCRHLVGLGFPFASNAPGCTPEAGLTAEGPGLSPGALVKPSTATTFLTILMTTHYALIVSGFQLIGGALLLVNKFVPLGLTLAISQTQENTLALEAK